MFGLTRIGLVSVASGVAALLSAPAQSEQFSFAGKQVKIAIGYGVGGTYGKYSQMFADHLKDHIPGNPTITVDSRPGAGGMRMTNYAAKAMPADGYNYIVPPDTSVLVQLMQPGKAKYDMREFTWIGTANQTNTIVVVRSDTGVKTWEELRDKEVPMAAAGLGSTGYIIPKLVNGVLGTKIKVVSGYKGSSKAGLSVEQGETRGASYNWLFWRSKYERWFQGNDPYARALIQVGYFRDPDVPESVPMLKEVVKPEDKSLVEFVGALGLIGRGLAAPPGTPKAAIAVMRTAWNKMITDPKFISDAARRKLRVTPVAGDKVQQVVNDTINNTKPGLIKRTRQKVYGN